MNPDLRRLESRIRRLWNEGTSDARMHYGGFREWRRALAKQGFTNLRGRRVLDIGCGDRAPMSLLLAACGANVDAIDLMPVRVGVRRPLMWFDLYRHGGLRAALRQLARDALHTWRYWRELRRLAGRPLPFSRVRFQAMDAEQLRFCDESFDIVVSSAVWEHIADVRKATREVNRVLRPGGIAVIQVALFPSLQGGHHAEWHVTTPDQARTIRAWDHLLPDSVPLPLFCNGWREQQYREVFDDELTIVRWEGSPYQGAELLTPALREALAAYSERDLLMPTLTVWATKRGSPADGAKADHAGASVPANGVAVAHSVS